MIPLFDSILGLAKEIFQFVNTEASRKYIDHAVDLELRIQKEENRGPDSDDAKIESLKQELKVIVNAAQTELNLYRAKGNS
jgi:hypothetical protein